MRSLLILFLLLAVSCHGSGESPRSDDGLPVTGIAGPAVADLAGPCVVAHLLANGNLTLDGRPVEPDRLADEFRALAPAPDDESEPNPVALAIRADRTVAWSRVRHLIRKTAGRQGVKTLLFCVRHAGDGKEGTFLVRLPMGLATSRSEGRYLRTTGRFTVPAPPAAILPALGSPKRGIHLDPHPGTSLSYVLGLFDSLARGGHRSVALEWGRDGASGPVTGMRLDGRPVPPAEVALPVPPRSLELAGIHLTNGDGAGSRAQGLTMDRLAVTVLGRGGSWEEVDAIVADLESLAGSREEDGNWSAPGISDVRSTGLAVLAFLAAGQTHRAGEHRRVVRAGLKYLKQGQARDGRMAENPEDHAIATWAMTKAYSLTRSPLFTQSARQALAALTDEGGAWTVLAREEAFRAELSEESPKEDVAAALRTALAGPMADDDPRRFLARAAKWLF